MHENQPVFTQPRSGPTSRLKRGKHWYLYCTEFVMKVWEPHDKQEICFLAARPLNSSELIEEPFSPQDVDGVLAFFERHVPWENDLYFCPNSFSAPVRLSEHALATPYGWSTIILEALPFFEHAPSLMWNSANGWFEGLWIWNRYYKPESAEAYAKTLSYIFGGHKADWSFTKLLRVPNTFNNESGHDRFVVSLETENWKLRLRDPLSIPASLKKYLDETTPEPSTAYQPNKSAKKIVKRYRTKLGQSVLELIDKGPAFGVNQSHRIQQIAKALYDAGADREETATVLLSSPYFHSKYGFNLHILKAEVDRTFSSHQRHSN